MKNKIYYSLLILIGFASCNYPHKALIKQLKLKEGIYAQIKTNKGVMYAQIAYEMAPLTASNFIALAEGDMPNKAKRLGTPFYNGLTFYRVMPDFMVETGDPSESGNGTPGYTFKNEIVPTLKHDALGTLSMVNSGPNSNNSKFFITQAPTPWLDGKHSVFGHIIKGQDVLKKLEKGDVMESVIILRVGKEARKFEAMAMFNSLK